MDSNGPRKLTVLYPDAIAIKHLNKVLKTLKSEIATAGELIPLEGRFDECK